jgi:hypothetical protein
MVVLADAYPNYSLYAIIIISYDSTDDWFSTTTLGYFPSVFNIYLNA